MRPPLVDNIRHLQSAISIATEVHRHQLYKDREPYIMHVFRVAQRVERMMPFELQVIAVLHDVLEDGPSCNMETLREAGFSAAVIEAVCVLTREPEGDYEAYIQRVGAHPLARLVKIADLTDHLDLSRNLVLDEADVRKQQRYLWAYQFLCDSEVG